MLRRRPLLRGLAAGAALCSPWLRARAAGPAPAAYSSADLAAAARLRERALQDTRAWTLLQALCGDIGARPAGSAADARAVAWAQQALRELGLQRVRAEPLPLRVWQRGPASAVLVVPGAQKPGAPQRRQPLVMAALGNSVPTPPEGLQAELAWYESLAALQAEDPASSRARGRIVFIDQRTERTRTGAGYSAAVGARSQGAIEAARRGALAVGIRSIGTSGSAGSSGEPVAHTGAMRYDLSLPRIPGFAVSVADAEQISALHAAGAPLRLELQLQARSDVEATTHNVIAEIPGSDLAQEVVLISAHLDSWDVGQGAQDDGAGVAIVSAAAGVLAQWLAAEGLQLRRTLRVVLFGNEENGFDGARAYGDRYRDTVHQLVGESDFGAGRVWQLDSRVQPAALPLVDAMAQVLAPRGVAAPPAESRNRANPGPDAALLMRRHRWPGIALAQDGTHYFDVHHTSHDTLDRIDPATLPQNVACWAVVAWLAAQAPLAFGPPTL